MVQRWPRASRGAVQAPPRPDTDGRWGVARLVAEREAERRAREEAVRAPDAPAPPGPDAAPVPARRGPVPSPAVAPDSVTGPQREVEEAADAVGPPAPRSPEPLERPPMPPVPRPPAPPRPLPAPRRPLGRIDGASDQRAPRPRIDPDPSLFGFARRTRGRLGSRVFTLFFVLVFGVILAQTIASIV